MGIDVNLYAVTEATDDQVEAARELLMTRSRVADHYEANGEVHWYAVERWDHQSDWGVIEYRVRANVDTRYYGIGYERGDWPSIYGAIRLLQAAFPGAKVYYGGDTSDDGEECTPEMLNALWEHCLGPNGDNYRAWHRRFNASPEPLTAPRSDEGAVSHVPGPSSDRESL